MYIYIYIYIYNSRIAFIPSLIYLVHTVVLNLPKTLSVFLAYSDTDFFKANLLAI